MVMQIQTEAGMQTLPRKGSWWRHRNGNLYQVISVSNLSDRQDEYPASVTYVGPNGKEWTKEIGNFLKKMKPHSEHLVQWMIRHMGRTVSDQMVEHFRNELLGLAQETEDHARQRTHYASNQTGASHE